MNKKEWDKDIAKGIVRAEGMNSDIEGLERAEAMNSDIGASDIVAPLRKLW